jgi:hypothetical protein
MRTITRTLVIASVLGVILSACGGDGESADSSTTAAPSTTATTTTTAATTTAAAPSIVPGEDPEVDAVVAAYSVVFDSATTFEEKAPYITDPTGLEETVADYTAAGETLGGITLLATEVVIDGDTAAVTYSFLFGGNPRYEGLVGDAVRGGPGWQITREMFCGIMESARVGCP